MLVHKHSASIINKVINSNKSNTDTDWYQDIVSHEGNDGNRISVIRSQVSSTGYRDLLLGVSNASNSYPVGITVRRTPPDQDDGTFVVAPNNNMFSTSQIRNIVAGTDAKTSGSSALTNGSIYLQYE